MAGALGASALTGSPTAKEQLPSKIASDNPAPKMAHEAVKGLKTNQPQKPDRKHLLESIAFIESSGGKNMDHPWIEKGPHAGTRAVGKFAFMPKTVHELVDKSPKLKAKYGEVLNRDSQGGVEDFFTENPQFENDLANHYVDQIEKYGKVSDPGSYHVAWENGITGLNNLVDKNKLNNVERYNKGNAAYEHANKLHQNRVNLNLAKK